MSGRVFLLDGSEYVEGDVPTDGSVEVAISTPVGGAPVGAHSLDLIFGFIDAEDQYLQWDTVSLDINVEQAGEPLIAEFVSADHVFRPGVPYTTLVDLTLPAGFAGDVAFMWQLLGGPEAQWLEEVVVFVEAGDGVTQVQGETYSLPATGVYPDSLLWVWPVGDTTRATALPASVEVLPAPGFSIELDQDELVLMPGEQTVITATLTPEPGFSGEIWVSSELPFGLGYDLHFIWLEGTPEEIQLFITAANNLAPGSNQSLKLEFYSNHHVDYAVVPVRITSLPDTGLTLNIESGTQVVRNGMTDLLVTVDVPEGYSGEQDVYLEFDAAGFYAYGTPLTLVPGMSTPPVAIRIEHDYGEPGAETAWVHLVTESGQPLVSETTQVLVLADWGSKRHFLTPCFKFHLVERDNSRSP